MNKWPIVDKMHAVIEAWQIKFHNPMVLPQNLSRSCWGRQVRGKLRHSLGVQRSYCFDSPQRKPWPSRKGLVAPTFFLWFFENGSYQSCCKMSRIPVEPKQSLKILLHMDYWKSNQWGPGAWGLVGWPTCSGLPWTVLVSELKIPCLRKPRSPRQTGTTGHPTWLCWSAISTESLCQRVKDLEPLTDI